jgi:hypothetical protein
MMKFMKLNLKHPDRGINSYEPKLKSLVMIYGEIMREEQMVDSEIRTHSVEVAS